MNTKEENAVVEQIMRRADRLMKNRQWVWRAVNDVLDHIVGADDHIAHLIADAVQLYDEAPADGSTPLRIHLSAKPYWDTIRLHAWKKAEQEVSP